MAQNRNSLPTKDDLQPIVPLGMLTPYGCKMRWHCDGCALRHGRLGELQVTVRDNCPYVSSAVGMKLIQGLEAAEMEKKRVLRSLEVSNIDDSKKELVVNLDDW